MAESYIFKKKNNKGADQTSRIRRLVGAFVVRIQQKQFQSIDVQLMNVFLSSINIGVLNHELKCLRFNFYYGFTNNFIKEYLYRFKPLF